MFYRLDDEFVSINYDEISSNALTIGYVTQPELEQIYRKFGFSAQAFEESRKAEMIFSPMVRFYDRYVLAKLDVSELDCHISFFASKNLFLAITPESSKVSYRDIFMEIISRMKNTEINEGRLIGCFLERIMDNYKLQTEKLQSRLDTLEEKVLEESTDEDFNKELLTIKNQLLMLRCLFEQITELCEGMNENECDVFDAEELKCLCITQSRALRYRERVDLLRDNVDHIWDSYQASLDIQLNRSMKTFTVLTTIFFPITVIVGWYGMNFRNMPELEWKYGYAYVIVLTFVIIIVLIIWFRKRKWI